MATDWSAWTQPAFGGEGGLLGNPWQYIGDLGAGLLANSGPSFEPQGGFGARLGKGMQYANAMNSERTMNDARRQAMLSEAKEQQGLQLFQNWMAANGDATDEEKLTAAMSFVPNLALKSWITNATDPLRLLQVQSAQQGMEEKGAEIAASKVDNQRIYDTSVRAADAVQFLRGFEGGESVLVNAEWIPALRKAKAGGWLTSGITGELASFLGKIPKDQWGNVLDAAEAVEKARNAISNSKSNNAGVMGLQSNLTSMGSGAGLNLQEELFSDAATYAKEAASLSKWPLPEPDKGKYSWRRNAVNPDGTSLYNSEGATWGEPGAPTVITPQPGVPQRTPAPAPQQATAGPPPTKVQTQQLYMDPDTGVELKSYPRAVDGERAARASGQKRFVAPHPETGEPWIYEVD